MDSLICSNNMANEEIIKVTVPSVTKLSHQLVYRSPYWSRDQLTSKFTQCSLRNRDILVC